LAFIIITNLPTISFTAKLHIATKTMKTYGCSLHHRAMKFTTKLLDVKQDRMNLSERLQNASNVVLLHSTFRISVWQLRRRLKIRLSAFLQVYYTLPADHHKISP